MENVYISEKAYPETIRHIREIGIEPTVIKFDPRLGEFTGDHPDLRLTCVRGSAVFAGEGEYRPDYPGNAAYCAAVFDGYLIHRLDITAPRILEAAEGLKLINVRQGYAKCSTVIVDGKSLITSDVGIFRAAEETGVLSALLVSKGNVLLPGYPEGFIGGASGRVRDELIFNGSLETHPDGEKIRAFISGRGVKIWEASGLPLRDIGSIIYTNQKGRA
ncbi:MAG: hypothetical protein II443_03710 [Oscillospiraceae bacterium]|nr:hypothetical protein [Oscillospiraceae bacterium]